MTAYSFKLRFVPNIQAGLGLPVKGLVKPKRQTIRAPRKRHAVPGEEMQLYYAIRTKQCQLIGKAVCMDVHLIRLFFMGDGMVDCDAIGMLKRQSHLDQFAQLDGFIDWMELRSFWASNHPGIDRFEGVLIRWMPLSPA